MEKTVKAWAVWNTNLNVPCVLTVGENESIVVMGSAIWVDDYGAKAKALEYLNKFSEEARKDLCIKLKRITITLS